MVWDPPRQEVNVTRMIIYSVIPFLDIYSAWRIQKFWVIGGIQLLGLIGLSLTLETFLPVVDEWLYGILYFFPEIIIAIFLTRHFARKYNEKIESGS